MSESKQPPGAPEPEHPPGADTFTSTAVSMADELAAAYRVMAEGVCIIDARGRPLLANPAAAALMGVESHEALMASAPEEVARRFRFFDASGAPVPIERLPGFRVLRGERLPPEELRCCLVATGEERWVRFVASPITNEAGVISRVVLFLRDVTAERRAADEHRFLSRASALLAQSLDPDETLQALVRLCVPELADWCFLDLVDENGAPRLVASAHRDPRREELAREMRRRYPPKQVSPVTRAIQSGETYVAELSPEQVEQNAADADHLALLRTVGVRAVMAVPLLARGRLVGV
ncbi:MAG TPA: GAF domain-containing protein, partial [Myxococcaceae bacterium]|nr:GAF domain-containing protein [Myxococcaceae bacterium]